MPRVLIADDHASARVGYRQFLEAEPSIEEIGEAASGEETMDVLRRRDWDLLMMDLSISDRRGLDILERAKSTYPHLRVLIVSALPEEHYARTALRAGASGYLTKDRPPEEMLQAVRHVLSGRRYVSTSLAESMAADLEFRRNPDIPPHRSLSTREFQVFCKLAGGASVSAIAAEMSLNVKTVSTYRTRMLEKMRFKTNADITGYALRNRLI